MSVHYVYFTTIQLVHLYTMYYNHTACTSVHYVLQPYSLYICTLCTTTIQLVHLYIMYYNHIACLAVRDRVSIDVYHTTFLLCNLISWFV